MLMFERAKVETESGNNQLSFKFCKGSSSDQERLCRYEWSRSDDQSAL